MRTVNGNGVEVVFGLGVEVVITAVATQDGLVHKLFVPSRVAKGH